MFLFVHVCVIVSHPNLTRTRTLTQAKANVDFITAHTDPSTGLVAFGYYGDWLAVEVIYIDICDHYKDGYARGNIHISVIITTMALCL